MAFRFRAPLGLVLCGGGSHGAWQAGALEALCEAGLAFERAFGFSAGSLNGAAYLVDRLAQMREAWREMDALRVLRWKPAFTPGGYAPFALYSGEALVDAAPFARDDEDSKRRARCELTVATLCVRDRALEYARFTPRGADGWDGPLYDQLLASCAVPTVFPPVRMEGERGPRMLVDGGVPGRDRMRFVGLPGCADIVVLQMTRPEEAGRWLPWLWRGFDQLGRVVCLRHMDDGVEDVLGWPGAPRVFRLYPSRVLKFHQLRFVSKHTTAAFELGRGDAAALLKDPEARQVPPPTA